jgi:hypothetical protein
MLHDYPHPQCCKLGRLPDSRRGIATMSAAFHYKLQSTAPRDFHLTSVLQPTCMQIMLPWPLGPYQQSWFPAWLGTWTCGMQLSSCSSTRSNCSSHNYYAHQDSSFTVEVVTSGSYYSRDRLPSSKLCSLETTLLHLVLLPPSNSSPKNAGSICDCTPPLEAATTLSSKPLNSKLYPNRRL